MVYFKVLLMPFLKLKKGDNQHLEQETISHLGLLFAGRLKLNAFAAEKKKKRNDDDLPPKLEN